MGHEQKLVLWSFALVFVTFAVMGLLMERTVQVTQFGSEMSFSGDVAVQYTPLGESSSNGRVKAMIKGSIYETGSNMTVFGACFDGDGYLLPEAVATFTAWYPNGSIVTGPNASMDKIYDDFYGYDPNGTGRWKIHVTMSDTIGTYLTEMRCEYQDQWAVAFGEWQNPEWVARIGATQGVVNNISADFSAFRNDTANNFSTIISMLGGASAADVENSTKLKEIYNAVLALPAQFWVLDDKNPTYSIGSGMNNFDAVDMIDEDNVCAAGIDGTYQCWDGNVWTYGNLSGYSWYGVGILDAQTSYMWMVGDDGAGTAYYSVNGGSPQTIGVSSSSVFTDVKLVRAPNDPAGNITVYVLGDADLMVSTDFGSSWSVVASVTPTDTGRMSEIVWNAQPDSTSGYRYAVVTKDGQLFYYDGSSIQGFTDGSLSFTDVVLVSPALGYIVGVDSGDGKNKVWSFDGDNVSSLTEKYIWEQSGSAEGKGIAASSTDDVWVVTNDPSVFYHYDGFAWKYVSFPYSGYSSVMISFGNFSFSMANGMNDIVMSDAFNGYAVGSDGLILKLMNKQDAQYEDLLASLNGSMSVNLSSIISMLSAMNSSIAANFTLIDQKIDDMNVSIQYKLDNVLNNVTYTQLYLDTTLFPMVNATYQNTILILQQLGILSAQINQTIELQNQTLQIVNSTDQKVDQLLNKSNRIRAWVTQ